MSYREILYGVLFGVGACVIDIVMHARMTDRSFVQEFIQPSAEMLFYRVLFLIFGLGVGFTLWQKNKREREARRLSEILQRLRREIAAPVTLIYANTQLLLSRREATMPPDVESVLQSIYEQSKKLQSVTRE
jgi:signal transduction histidine kinase